MDLNTYLTSYSISQSVAGKALSVSAGRIGHFCRGEDIPPPKVCVRIEAWSGGAVTRKELRPEDWQLIWPELAELPQSA